jgi:hypothetical protein
MLLIAAETSKTPFYIAAALLVLWAFTLFAIGMRSHEDWPSSERTARTLMAVSAVLVLATMATAVATA